MEFRLSVFSITIQLINNFLTFITDFTPCYSFVLLMNYIVSEIKTLVQPIFKQIIKMVINFAPLLVGVP